MGKGRKSQRDRDAVTVEIGYALFSAGFLALVAFGVVAGPALAWDLPRWATACLLVAAAAVAATLAVIRVVHVLRAFEKRRGTTQ
jgi:hypothetical protein